MGKGRGGGRGGEEEGGGEGRVTLWKPGLFIINRAENKRLYIYQYFFFWF